jgi:hypothetical protein
MRLIEYPSYTHHRARKTLKLTAATAMAVFVVFVLTFRVSIFALPLLLLFLLVMGKATLEDEFRTWVRGYQGEKHVQMLLSALPDSYTLVTAFVAPGTKHGDTDALLLGPHGVLVIEIKTYAGNIEFDNGRWYRRTNSGFRIALKANPSAQAKRNEASVAQFVGHYLSSIPAASQFAVPCYCSVVFCETRQINTPGLQSVQAVLAKDVLRLVSSLQPALNIAQVGTLSLVFLEGSRSANGAVKNRKAARTM